jgi:hypothetical protein
LALALTFVLVSHRADTEQVLGGLAPSDVIVPPVAQVSCERWTVLAQAGLNRTPADREMRVTYLAWVDGFASGALMFLPPPYDPAGVIHDSCGTCGLANFMDKYCAEHPQDSVNNAVREWVRGTGHEIPASWIAR